MWIIFCSFAWLTILTGHWMYSISAQDTDPTDHLLERRETDKVKPRTAPHYCLRRVSRRQSRK